MLGTVETNAAFGHALIKHAMPSIRQFTVRRPAVDVIRSLAACGIVGIDDEIHKRDADLDAAEAAGAERIEFAGLRDVCVCERLWQECLGAPFDYAQWRKFDATNLQVDVLAQVSRVNERQDELTAFEAEVRGLSASLPSPQFVSFTWESVKDNLQEAAPHMERQYAEVWEGRKPHQPLKLDAQLIDALERHGALITLIARVNGVMAGYLMWTISPDAESAGQRIARQGSFYVDPRHASLGLGRKLLMESIAGLRRIGIQLVQMHAPTQGRGIKLGRLFEAMGAIPTQQQYSLWIGGEDA